MILRDAPRRRLRERLGTAVTGSWRFGPGFAGSAEAARIWARLHRVLIKLRGRSNVRFGPLCGLKSGISRGPRSAAISRHIHLQQESRSWRRAVAEAATPAGGVARGATLPRRAPFQSDNLISDNAARPFGPYGLPSDSHISK